MADTFQVCSIPDGGEFADGNTAALAWDILHRTADHRAPEVLDLSKCRHLKPYALACLCGLAELAKVNGQPTVRVIAPDDSSCAEHFARLGLPAFFEGDWATAEVRDTNISINRVVWPPENQGERIVEVLAPRAGLAPGLFPRMVEGLDEIILNALTHANSPIDCIVAGQAFPKTGKVEVAALDLGQTIRSHLAANPKYQSLGSHTEAIFKAVEEGVSGTPDGQRNSRGEQNSGAGLAFLREYCQAGGGELTVFSGDAWVTFRPELTPVVGSFQGHFQGCLVNIRYFCEVGLPAANSEPIL